TCLRNAGRPALFGGLADQALHAGGLGGQRLLPLTQAFELVGDAGPLLTAQFVLDPVGVLLGLRPRLVPAVQRVLHVFFGLLAAGKALRRLLHLLGGLAEGLARPARVVLA